MNILIDTREQLPLFRENSTFVKRCKLEEGDYTTESLFNIAHAERKSGIDFYGSIIQGHKRFLREIQRAIEKDLTFAVFIECTLDVFVRKQFKGGQRLKIKSEVLAKIIHTLISRYPIQFIFCDDKTDMRDKMLRWFLEEESKL